jgi:hypothetical protein
MTDYPLDPVSRFDALGRKEPKRIGYMEVVRGLPWLADAYDRIVPPENYIIDAGQAVVRCVCEEVTHVEWNRTERCAGDCGRWFWYIAGRVRAARE